MKTKIILILTIISFSFIYSQQGAKKPVIMLFPSTSWFEHQGNEKYKSLDDNGDNVYDYKRAFQESSELNAVLSKIAEQFTNRTAGKFNIKVLKEAASTSVKRSTRESLINSGGSKVKSSEENDFVSRQINYDIKLEIDYWPVKEGPKNNYKFNFNALDAYTNEQVASVPSLSGVPTFSNDILTFVDEAINNKIDPFFDQLDLYFTDMFENGRKAAFDIVFLENTDDTFETEFAGDELRSHFEDWFSKNAVKGKYNLAESSDLKLNFEEVRIPVFDENNRAMSADLFAKKIKKTFETAPYNYKVGIKPSGMGFTLITLSKK